MKTIPRNDLKFFTNEPDETLYDRFVRTLRDVQYFDVLVGYFRTSGFRRLYESLETVDKVRILVGLSVDRNAFTLLETARLDAQRGVQQGELGFASHHQVQAEFSDALVREMEASADNLDMEISARKFIEFIQSGKLELRAFRDRNMHAKVYISRFGEDDRDFGRVITGSSNFSENGLVAQREFNVELKDAPDVEYALAKFEELWAESVDISEAYIDTLRTKTWLSDNVTPFGIYLKFLYEYFKEDINIDQDVDFYLPEGFMELAYQRQAVLSAKKILEAYNGVFLADVVGLGKTFISALLLQQLPGRKLIICPPVLADYWRATLFEFGVPQCRIESLGQIDRVLREGAARYDYVLIDEAHRFRNEATQSFETLHKICAGKKVILVSATPLNNKLGDILALLKLFQPAKKSSIPGVKNLQSFFDKLRLALEATRKSVDGDRSDPVYIQALNEASAQVRSKVLNHVMVRRTRTEIKNYFSEDLEGQGLSFPELAAPERIVYQFDEATGQVFDDTIALLKEFQYARYAPLLYLKHEVGVLEQQSQHNVRGFMKGVLVKRLESSFYAFKKTVRRFTESYERFIGMFRSGAVYISKKFDVYDLLESDDEARLIELAEHGEVQSYAAGDFEDDFLVSLNNDLLVLRSIERMWQRVETDPKLEQFLHEVTHHPLLKGQKLIVFTESKETGEYLYTHLEEAMPGKAFFYASQGGIHRGVSHGVTVARDLIKANFDPNQREQKDDIRVLVTTDVLAEGINLHRSNVVINYDLPWNPTRVLQRVGRINRVGAAHETAYVFNFFPTDQSDAHLGLEGNIKAKIQAFHDTLGEDAKYLTDDEEVTTHALFGDRLYQTLTSKESLEQEEDERSELQYLQLLRDVRDKEPELFERVKRLPKKARSAKRLPNRPLGVEGADRDALITFFRRGRLKKFFLSDGASDYELEFFQAAELFACKPDEPRRKIPPAYYDLLAKNDDAFRLTLTEDLPEPKSGAKGGGGHSSENKLRTMLKSREVTRFKGFTDDDEVYLGEVRQALEAGTVAKNTTKTVMSDLKAAGYQPLTILNVLKQHIGESTFVRTAQDDTESVPREVILSEYLVGNE